MERPELGGMVHFDTLLDEHDWKRLEAIAEKMNEELKMHYLPQHYTPEKVFKYAMIRCCGSLLNDSLSALENHYGLITEEDFKNREKIRLERLEAAREARMMVIT